MLFTQNIDHFIIGSETYNQVLESIPGSVFCKDKNGRYLDVNHIQVYSASATRFSDLIGKNDHGLAWQEQAPACIQNDKEVIYTEKPKTFIEQVIAFGKNRSFLSYKFPLKNKSEKIMGILGMSFLLDEPEVIQHWLTDSKFLINSPENLINLEGIKQPTQREIECLYHLIKGLTLKQIAKKLSISPRTVEHHLENIKIKLNCTSRAELITKALQLPAIKKMLLPLKKE